MPWIFAYLILFIIIVIALSIPFWETTTWKNCFIRWFFLFLPVAIFMWDYPITYYRHVEDCKTEGGLKVYIQPERSDSVQLGTKHFSRISAAEDLLKKFHPKLKEVEVGDDYYNNDKRKRDYQYYAVSVAKTTDDRFKRGWEFNQKDIPRLSEDMYIFSKSYKHNKSLHRTKTQWQLTKNGKTYATITQFVHTWPKIQYPDATPAWTCEDVYKKYINPYYDLIQLILNN